MDYDNKLENNESRIKLVLCDNQMDYVNAYVVAKIRKHLNIDNKLQQIPILVCTTEAAKSDKEFLIEEGFDFVTAKYPP